MDKQVTMQTKGIVQDENGYWGIWRTLPKFGRIFIRVGETGNDAVKRRANELLNMPIKKLKKQKQYSNGMTSQEFALWYEKLGEYKSGGYFDITKRGEMYIPIGNKIVITSGTYEEPIAKRVLVFTSEDDMVDWLKRRKDNVGRKNGETNRLF